MEHEFWQTEPIASSSLCHVQVEATAPIDDQHGCLQADFANQYIGGGVLHHGNVQEEIRFSVCPDLFASIAMCARMLSTESIEMRGACTFCTWTGYGKRFRFDG